MPKMYDISCDEYVDVPLFSWLKAKLMHFLIWLRWLPYKRGDELPIHQVIRQQRSHDYSRPLCFTPMSLIEECANAEKQQ